MIPVETGNGFGEGCVLELQGLLPLGSKRVGAIDSVILFLHQASSDKNPQMVFDGLGISLEEAGQLLSGQVIVCQERKDC